MLNNQQIREFSIARAASSLGGELFSGSKSTHRTPTWVIAEQKIVITTDLNKWFCNKTGDHGTGAASLVMHVNGCDFYSARDYLSGLDTSSAITYKTSSKGPATHESTSEECEVLVPHAVFNADAWPVIFEYLTGRDEGQRCLDPELVINLHNDGLVGATRVEKDFDILDAAGNKTGNFHKTFLNAVFQREFGGFFWRAASASSNSRQVVGSAVNGCFVLPGNLGEAYIFVESAIDAMSLKCLYPAFTIIALGGNAVPLTLSLVDRLAPSGAEVYASFNTDKRGQEYNAKLLLLRPDAQVLVPDLGGDWNEHLVALRRF